MCVCACVRACVRVCVRACVRVCVCGGGGGAATYLAWYSVRNFFSLSNHWSTSLCPLSMDSSMLLENPLNKLPNFSLVFLLRTLSCRERGGKRGREEEEEEEGRRWKWKWRMQPSD